MKLGGASIAECFGPFALDKSTAFASFTTRQDCSPRPIPRIPGGILAIGDVLKIEAEGEYSTTGTPNLTWGLYLGTYDDAAASTPAIVTVIAESSVIVTPSGAAAFHWRMEWRGKVTKTGASGTIIGTGDLEQGTSLTAETTLPIPITAALRTIAINTTVDNRIGVCATYGTSSASNIFQTYNVTCMRLN